MEKVKNVSINTPYITLQQLLKYSGIISEGGEAKLFLTTNVVLVNGESEVRRGRKIYPGYKIEIGETMIIVDAK
ncbi:MAG: S4 domain-containing protein YaaA [Bacilli bacterium]